MSRGQILLSLGEPSFSLEDLGHSSGKITGSVALSYDCFVRVMNGVVSLYMGVLHHEIQLELCLRKQIGVSEVSLWE